MQKVRDDRESGQNVETEVAQRQGTEFSHGIWPDGAERGRVPPMRAVGLEPTRPQGLDDRPRAQRVAPAGAGSGPVAGA